MSTILDASESSFIEKNKDLLSDYLSNKLIFETLQRCTKRQINRNNFIERFGDFFECLRRKMFQMTTPTESVIATGLLPDQSTNFTIPEIINSELIVRAVLIGYEHLKDKIEEFARLNGMDLDELENFSEVGFTVVLVIIARENLQSGFSN